MLWYSFKRVFLIEEIKAIMEVWLSSIIIYAGRFLFVCTGSPKWIIQIRFFSNKWKYLFFLNDNYILYSGFRCLQTGSSPSDHPWSLASVVSMDPSVLATKSLWHGSRNKEAFVQSRLITQSKGRIRMVKENGMICNCLRTMWYQ